MEHPSACSAVVRRRAERAADELAILCRPDGPSPDPVRQAEAVYRALAELLSSHRASAAELTCETLFLRAVGDVPHLLAVRTRVLGEVGGAAGPPSPVLIQQAPADGGACFELAASAVVPHTRASWSVRDVCAVPSCPCAGCARSGARLVRLGGRTSLHSANVYGARGGDAFAEAWNMFAAAEQLLEQCGMEFRDVVRTWIYLRDIGRDYDALNRARREFFRARGVERLPASTGVQGGPVADAHDFSMTLNALRSTRALEVTPVSTPSLSEAWAYGADFSRALRVVEGGEGRLHVSGTASIDEAGRSVHAGDFRAQCERMLHNIDSLLVPQGASVESVISGVAYVKDAADAPVLREMFRERGLTGFPCALVETPLCRPELLCETEVVAVLPSAAPGA